MGDSSYIFSGHENTNAFSHLMNRQIHFFMWYEEAFIGLKNYFINYNYFSTMKITLNSISFALFIKNLQNDHHAHRFAEGFLLILKAKQGFMVHED